MNKRQIVLKAAELISAGKCENVGARDADGNPIPCYDPDAVYFCMIGALGAAMALFAYGSMHQRQMVDATTELANELELFLVRTGRVPAHSKWVGKYSDRNDAATVAKAFRDWAKELA